MSKKNAPGQDNIGYENTTESTNQDNKEMDRPPTTDTDHGQDGNKPDADTSEAFDDSNSSGLRSESGKKTQAKGEDSQK